MTKLKKENRSALSFEDMLRNKMIDAAYEEIGFNIGIRQQHSDTLPPWICEKFYKKIVEEINATMSDYNYRWKFFVINDMIQSLNKEIIIEVNNRILLKRRDTTIQNILINLYGAHISKIKNTDLTHKDKNFLNMLLCELLEDLEHNYKDTDLYAIAYLNSNLQDNATVVVFKERYMNELLGNYNDFNDISYVSSAPVLTYSSQDEAIHMINDSNQNKNLSKGVICSLNSTVLYVKDRTKNFLINTLNTPINLIFKKYKNFVNILLQA